MSVQPVLINGKWRQANHKAGTFHAMSPATGEKLPEEYPISDWADCDAALAAAAAAFEQMQSQPATFVADFLEKFAQRLADNAPAICQQAALETALPLKPRLADVEMPRTINQLKLAAAAAREGTWRQATIDSAAGIRSGYGPLGPVLVIGPNNFPLAFNGISGGDFAAALAAGNPVIAKAHPSHPRTSQLMAEQAHEAAQAAGLPTGAVQMLYKMPRPEGERMVGDARLASCGFTGSRPAGMALKKVADAAGKPIYLEMSSVNPIFFLPSVVKQKRADLVGELAGSALMGSGQFCTSPNLFVLFAGPDADAFIAELKAQLESRLPRRCFRKAFAKHWPSRSPRCKKGGPNCSPAGPRPTARPSASITRCSASPARSFSRTRISCRPRLSATRRWPSSSRASSRHSKSPGRSKAASLVACTRPRTDRTTKPTMRSPQSSASASAGSSTIRCPPASPCRRR